MHLNDLEPIYFPNEVDLDKVLFYPILLQASTCKCMSGYFTSGALSELARSLSYYLSIDDNYLEFIVSPNLDIRDINAMRDALAADKNLIFLLFPDFELSENSLKTKTIEALSFLVATKKLEIRLALMDEGLFHTKCWFFDTNEGKMAVHGSGNVTKNGLSINFEQLTVTREWMNEEASKVYSKLKIRYEKIWKDEYKGLKTYGLNEKTLKYLADLYNQKQTKTPNEIIIDLRESIEQHDLEERAVHKLIIPEWLNYSSGDYAHQGQAIKAWNDNKGRGILSIATGGGKTLTSLVAASLISQNEERLFLIIAVPTTPLLDQWEEDVIKFNINPINTSTLSAIKAVHKINNSIRKLKINASKVEVLITTHDSLKNEKYLKVLEKAQRTIPLMLIGDEVHNLGSIGFQESAPDYFKYRLGLSATAERQTDQEGTDFLLSYFGPIVFDYPLSEAIGNCLVPYKYKVHKVELEEEEADEWSSLTHRIKKLSFASKLSDDSPEKTRWKLLCLQRRRIVESAKGKIYALEKSLPDNSNEINRTLIFGTDKYPDQLQSVNQLLTDRKVLFHQVTGEETGNKKKLKKIIDSFSSDKLQVLTSKRVLDEGFNVPQTEVAYLLASNTILRQWIQRLGRVLRKSEKTNKTGATLHDFAVIPPIVSTDGEIDPDLRSLIMGELARVQYFDELSANGLEEDGASYVIEELLELIGAI